MKPWGLTLLLTLAAVPSSACEHWGRVRECRAIALATNTAVTGIERRRDAGAFDAGMFRDIAVQYKRLGRELGELEVSSLDLRDAVAEYRAIFDSSAQTAQLMAASFEKASDAKQGAAREEFARLTRREKAMAVRIEALCRAP